MIDGMIKECEQHMKRCIENLARGFSSIRTGKATPSMLDGIQVEAYGTKMPINQMATLAAPEPRLLTVQPFDPSQIGAIEKAILASDLGINPSNDGNIIRLPVPALNEERRRDYVKMAKQKGEEAKVAIRGARRDANDQLKKAQSKSEITEDEMHRGQDRVQKLTDDYTGKVDEMLVHKEKEIMEV